MSRIKWVLPREMLKNILFGHFFCWPTINQKLALTEVTPLVLQTRFIATLHPVSYEEFGVSDNMWLSLNNPDLYDLYDLLEILRYVSTWVETLKGIGD